MELISLVAKLAVALIVLIWWMLKGITRGIIILAEYVFEYLPVVFAWIKKQFIWASRAFVRFVRLLLPRVVVFASLVAKAFKSGRQLLKGLIFPFSNAISPRLRGKILSKLSIAGMTVTFVLLFFLLFPDLALKVLPYQTEPIASAVDQSVIGGKFEDGSLYSKVELPDKNEYLPTGHWLVIPKIGVMTQIGESSYEKHEDVLRNGVWRVPDFADPSQQVSYPTILVAHKFGYLIWSNEFRRQNSFYNLDHLEIGDTFEIMWDQRRFVYEVYAGAEGKEITDYKADVILYTCKYLNSPVRIFRYARRVEY